ncbi:MAG: alpha/beta hydrolase [Phycisphaerales bacterium]|nr:alpha/beta hydrolase [Phycisphaerales bacterium]
MNRMRACLLILIASVLALTTFDERASAESHVVGEIDGRPLGIELVVPKGPGPHPVIAWIHGGAWWAGNHLQMPGFTRAALEAGFAVASLDYRLTSEAGRWGRASVSWPAQIHDCKAGIRWLRANARTHRLDADRIVAWGHSAGGHLTAMVGLTADDPELEGRIGPHPGVSSRVAVAVNFAGPSDLLNMNPDVTTPPGSRIDHDGVGSPESRLIGSAIHNRSIDQVRAHLEDPTPPWATLAERVRSASPVEHVDRDDRTILYIAHGKQDPIVPFNQAVRLEAACREHGVQHVAKWYENAGHGLPREAHVAVLTWLPEALGVTKDAKD